MSFCVSGRGFACVPFSYFEPMHPAVPIVVLSNICVGFGGGGITETFEKSKEFSILYLEVVNCCLLLFVDVN